MEQEKLNYLMDWYVKSIPIEKDCKLWWDSRVAGKTEDELTERQLNLKKKIEKWILTQKEVKSILEDHGYFVM